VTKDERLCPAGSVVMRDSMRKAKGFENVSYADTHVTDIGIVNTFLGATSSDSYGQLSRQLLLVLHALKVPRSIFLRLVEDEIQSSTIDFNDEVKGRKTAYKLVKGALKHHATTDQAAVSEDDHFGEHSTSGNKTTTKGSLAASSYHEIGFEEKAYKFLSSGAELSEPM
jgi:hypothetical protein